MGLTNEVQAGPENGADESTALNIASNGSPTGRHSSYGTITKAQTPAPPDITKDLEENDPERLLLPPQPDAKDGSVKGTTSIWGVISVLLLGEFIANADTTLVFASAGKISSEFASFQDANWLSTAYTLGVCVAQPVYGKLSDIYGRKPLLLLAYAFFALGSLICGLGREMWQVILGRAISGIGGAGTITVAAVIIADLVPKREIAAWRAYVNISMTLGRSLGGPTGGSLTDTFGWRWVFLMQAPLFCITAVLVILRLHIEPPQRLSPIDSPDQTITSKSKLKRVDFLGILCLATAIVSAILLLDLGGQKFPWLSLQTLFLSTTGTIFLILFILVEAYIAPEPIFSLRILRQPNVPASYAVMSLQIFSQVSMMFCVPLYFQVTSRASATAAGAHLVPAVAGNAAGGLVAGTIIRRTGRYKPLAVSAGLIASITYTLLLFRWNGDTNVWESLYIIPGGFGTGIAQACVFVSMTALLEPKDIAMATGGLFLFSNFGITGGITASSAALESEFRRQLERRLTVPGAEEIIRRATSDAHYIAGLRGRVREVVVACYVAGLKHTYSISLAGSLTASLIALTLRSHQL